jgi:PAS domain S-box-containing protein
LFESAQDGILILNARSGMITDVNPYLLKLLGRPQEEFLGKKLWEIGLFQDIEKSKAAFKELQQDGYIRYEDLPLETGDGRYIDVEFVSNSYMAGGVRVIQCNIRDITDRKHAEVERAILDTTEKEQRRIGHDLHDGLCQQLTGAALIAKTLSQKLLARQPDASAIAGEIVILINQAIRQTRDVARGLAPVEVEAAGLAPALEKFASKIERGHGIECVFIHDKSAGFRCRYAPFLATHLYRIVQEAVSNAIEHGKARHIVIKLATDSDQERGVLTIEDDGSGFDLKLSSKSGLGLRSMRYRGRMIGARLRVSRAGTQGMIVTCSFPHHHTTEAESS